MTITSRAADALAPPGAAWQSAAMAGSNEPKAGGALLALSILIGAIVGIVVHQASIGVLAGTAIGIALALLLWWRDRRRHPIE